MCMNKISIIRDAAEKAMAAETDRTKQLLGRAEKSAAAIIAVTAFQLVNIRTFLEFSFRVKMSCYLSLAALCLSLFFAFLSLRLKGYARYPRGDKLWENLMPENVSDDGAEQEVIHLLLKTREQNARMNDAKLRWLFWCGALFFVGFLLVIVSRLLAESSFNYQNAVG